MSSEPFHRLWYPRDSHRSLRDRQSIATRSNNALARWLARDVIGQGDWTTRLASPEDRVVFATEIYEDCYPVRTKFQRILEKAIRWSIEPVDPVRAITKALEYLVSTLPKPLVWGLKVRVQEDGELYSRLNIQQVDGSMKLALPATVDFFELNVNLYEVFVRCGNREGRLDLGLLKQHCPAGREGEAFKFALYCGYGYSDIASYFVVFDLTAQRVREFAGKMKHPVSKKQHIELSYHR